MHRLRNVPVLVLLMGIGAVLMFLPAIHAISLRNHFVARAFFYSGSLFLILVALIGLATSANRHDDTPRGQLLALLGAFVLLPLMLAVPMAEAIPDTTYLNAWWEMLSSVTTTGATLFAPDRLAPSIHLWRALVGWMGGAIILVSAVAVLAPMNLGGFEVLGAGSPSAAGLAGAAYNIRTVDLRGRLARAAISILPVYVGLTGLLWIALILAGDPSLVAACHAMSTLSTSGISPLGGVGRAPSGLGGEILIFLFLFFALTRRFYPSGKLQVGAQRLFQDPELRFGILFIVTLPALLFLRHWIGAIEIDEVPGIGQALLAIWGSIFTVLSFLTTTGFESESWVAARNWSGLATPGLILAGLAVIGGGVATTAGGVKLLRVYALYRHGEREIERLVHPSSIGGSGVMARKLRRQGAQMAWVFFMLFALSIAVTMLALSLSGLDFEKTTILSVAALSTTGPLANVAGSAPIDWAMLDAWAKTVLAAAMVLGRLETLAIIALLNPDFWRN
ncbi:TrkH family potassium uptake protein [Albidovulum sediminicola]|uniref:TrkH family potassium uptake protein n=1 Tax=Albidovulum sediminicola TaxID=2984331 RepID=A0ABT2Z3P3_9RHOB|nr:potassium transporter TrkG [Defluviimonas sp. WL0075]MCV2865721.1 TrkH family potassium uptake protein [Defluviimonas sp. WL0075]